jgi:hypothetical protein
VEALKRNALAAESELFVFCDGSTDDRQRDRVRQVREHVRKIDGFHGVNVIEQSKNIGLAASIIGGVTQVVNEYGRVIALEDDIVTSPYFLTYMNKALDIYEDEHRVMSVTGHNLPLRVKLPDTFFIYGGTNTWGWGTWKRAWAKFNPNSEELLDLLMKNRELILRFNFGGTYDYLSMLRDNAAGRNDSWGVRWYASVFLEGGYGLWPGRSLVNNIGFDGTGRHCGATDIYQVSQLADDLKVNKIPIAECQQARKAISAFYRISQQRGKRGIRYRSRLVIASYIPQRMKEIIKRVFA